MVPVGQQGTLLMGKLSPSALNLTVKNFKGGGGETSKATSTEVFHISLTADTWGGHFFVWGET